MPQLLLHFVNVTVLHLVKMVWRLSGRKLYILAASNDNFLSLKADTQDWFSLE